MPDVPDVVLHVADDVTEVLARAGAEVGDADPALPFWAFAWVGGLAIARHLVAHPAEVAGRSVFDLATGSGLCAIVAARLGAAQVTAADIDPLAEAALAVNARANRVRIGYRRGDVLDDEPPPVDVILAGDVAYEETMSRRTFRWLRRAAAEGARVLVGDPGRAYLAPDLVPIATYLVRTTRELENAEVKDSTVFTFPVERD